MASQDVWNSLLEMFSPREASAEVLPGDPTAARLITRMKTGPLPPEWRGIFEAADQAPEPVTVFAEPRTRPTLTPPTFWQRSNPTESPGLPLQHYGIYHWLAQYLRAQGPMGVIPGSSTIDVRPTRLPGGPDVEETLTHELGHLLHRTLGVRPPVGYTYHDLIHQTMLAPGQPPLDPAQPPRPPWHPPDVDTPPPSMVPRAPWHPPGETPRAATTGPGSTTCGSS